MKKSFVIWINAVLLMVIGMSSCSNDDEGSNQIVDPANIKINELLIFSKDKSSVEIAQTHVANYVNPQ